MILVLNIKYEKVNRYDYNFSLINKLEIVLVSFQHYIVHDALLSHVL